MIVETQSYALSQRIFPI